MKIKFIINQPTLGLKSITMLQTLSKLFFYKKKRKKSSCLNVKPKFRTTLPEQQLPINEWHKYVHSQIR